MEKNSTVTVYCHCMHTVLELFCGICLLRHEHIQYTRSIRLNEHHNVVNCHPNEHRRRQLAGSLDLCTNDESSYFSSSSKTEDLEDGRIQH